MPDPVVTPQAAEPLKPFPPSLAEAVKRLDKLPIDAHTAFIVDGTLDEEKTARLSIAFRMKSGWSFGGYLERRKTGQFQAGGEIIRVWS